MITIKNERFAKMYWELLPYCNGDFDLLTFMTYIIDIYPALKDSKTFDNEEYRWLSDEFIQNRISWSSSTIHRKLDQLEELGLIKKITSRNSKNKKARYIRLNIEINSDISSEISSTISSEISSKRTIKQNNRQTNQQTNRVSMNKDLNKEFGNPNVPLLEDVIKYIREIGCTWLSELEIEDFYNTVVSRGWKKAKGEPILEWHAYFKWFAEKDKPNYVGDQDLSEKNKDSIEGWLK